MIQLTINPKAAPFFLAGSQETACLFIHGFTASPSEVYPVARQVHDLAGLTVSAPLLPGHGLTPEALNQTDWTMWFQAVQKETESLLAHYNQVYLVGLSLGGLLALHTGYTNPGIKGIVAINTPFYNKNPLLTRLAPVIKYLCSYFPKPVTTHGIGFEKQGRFAYGVTPVKAFNSMMKLRRVVMAELSRIKAPLLVMQSVQDESVPMKSALYIKNQTGARVVKLPSSQHVATMGPDQELITRSIINFIEEIQRG
ncbi:MAG: alpha/beta hydrolase [Syntrophomonadaceae bacterium]|jgi:carboxylesterase